MSTIIIVLAALVPCGLMLAALWVLNKGFNESNKMRRDAYDKLISDIKSLGKKS